MFSSPLFSQPIFFNLSIHQCQQEETTPGQRSNRGRSGDWDDDMHLFSSNEMWSWRSMEAPCQLVKHLLVGMAMVIFYPIALFDGLGSLYNSLTFYRFADRLTSPQLWRVNCDTVTLSCSCYGHPNVCCPKGMPSKGFLRNLFMCAQPVNPDHCCCCGSALLHEGVVRIQGPNQWWSILSLSTILSHYVYLVPQPIGAGREWRQWSIQIGNSIVAVHVDCMS